MREVARYARAVADPGEPILKQRAMSSASARKSFGDANAVYAPAGNRPNNGNLMIAKCEMWRYDPAQLRRSDTVVFGAEIGLDWTWDATIYFNVEDADEDSEDLGPGLGYWTYDTNVSAKSRQNYGIEKKSSLNCESSDAELIQRSRLPEEMRDPDGRFIEQ
jgi:hypothetical protein